MNVAIGLSRRLILRKPIALLVAPGIGAIIFFVILPLAWIIRVSFYEYVEGSYMRAGWVVEHYLRFLGDGWYLTNVLWFSIEIAIFTTGIAVILAYPVALYMIQCRGRWRQFLYTLVLSPLLIGLVSLVFGWIVIFRGEGLLNSFTMWLGITSEPVRYLFSLNGVIILLVYISVPYIVLSLLDNLERMEPAFIEAATNVGANRWQCFFYVVLPLTTPGLYAGSLIVFALNFSAFAVPLMVGSPHTNMIGLVIFRQGMNLNNLPFAAAISVIMVMASVFVILIYSRLMQHIYLKRLGI